MNKTVLVIEDNADVRENIDEILELAGYKTILAENGKIGIQKAKEHIPDLILCDIMMPEMDGHDVIYFLSLNPKTSCIPLIFLTAKSETIDFRKGMELGADDYLTKPFEESTLIKAIEQRIKKSNQVLELIKANKSLNNEGEIFKNTKTKKLEPKSFIYLANSTPTYLYKLHKGQVKIFSTNDQGKELTTKLLGEGDYFGYHALLKGTDYNDSAIAINECEIELIPKQSFYDVMSSNGELAKQFIKLLSNDVMELESELLSLAYSSVKKRVANSLVKYADKQNNSSLIIPREELANMAGTSTESVIRTLSEFKKDGLIDINGKELNILNRIELKNYKY